MSEYISPINLENARFKKKKNGEDEFRKLFLRYIIK